MSSSLRADVVVIGGGLIGCLSALALAKRGLAVVVVERAPFASQAASRAAAGMLQIEAHPSLAMRRFCAASRDRYPDLVVELERRSGISVGLRRSGGLSLAFDPASRSLVQRELALHREVGLEGDWLEAAAVRRLEPAVSGSVIGAGLYEGDALVDPPRLLEAARAAAEDAGARVLCEREVEAVETTAGRVVGLHTSGERLATPAVVLAAGSWSAQIGGTGLAPGAVEPMRGQMLELRLREPLFGRLMVAPRAYLSPRPDGRVLVGATVERVGFEAAVTAGAAAALLAAAIEAVPMLADARLTGHWCGFRPRVADEMPAIGLGAVAGLVIATGHFRSGVVLAPLTAEIVAALVLGEPPPVDIAPFDPARLLARCPPTE